MLNHNGNEYHIINQGGERIIHTMAYRSVGSVTVEILAQDHYTTMDRKITESVLVSTYELQKLLEHREYMAEREAQEGQEELQFEHMEAIGL